jgi:hypothetical protein
VPAVQIANKCGMKPIEHPTDAHLHLFPPENENATTAAMTEIEIGTADIEVALRETLEVDEIEIVVVGRGTREVVEEAREEETEREVSILLLMG